MATVLEVALAWHEACASVIPIRANGTKRPALTEWKPYTEHPPDREQIQQWWGGGAPYGIAIICGKVSANLEMTEIEGRACDPESMDKILKALALVPGAAEVWQYLLGPEGYSERSPSGGLHLLYRIGDADVPGNTKIAQIVDGVERTCLAETRGEGGYVIVAPTPGVCHPSGIAWELSRGTYGRLPVISWMQREALHGALALALDRTPEPENLPIPAPRPVPARVRPVGDVSPGDDFEAQVDWDDPLLLGGAGWRVHSRHGNVREWTRPGKDLRDGISATTGRDPARDRLYVFSTSTIFKSEQSYTKFGAYALLHHNGDHHAAAKALYHRGFGSRAPQLPELGELSTLDDEVEPQLYGLDDLGNAARLWDQIQGRFHYIHETKRFLHWTGKVWAEDASGAIVREVERMTERMRQQASASGNEAFVKWAKSSRSNDKVNAAIKLVRAQEGCTRRVGDFDTTRHFLNVNNGILNLKTRTLIEHNPGYMMTRLANVHFDPRATCPEFHDFIEAAIPDEQLRNYVQRALGYTTLGDADQRSMFLIYGPSGTGKSTLMETIRFILGDYAVTAPAGTFRFSRDKSPSNDLHRLRGRRFVATSETADNAIFDEDLLKRITGRDEISSRMLYQEYESWTPECSIWIATNHPPKFNSDDDAIWRRCKLIPFTTQFLGDAERPDMARSVLFPEAAGILNWLLDGLADYLEHGLGEPDTVIDAARVQRLQADSVARFIEDKVAEGRLVLGEGLTIRASALHSMYVEWSRFSGDRPVMVRRFQNRLQTVFPQLRLVEATVAGRPFQWEGIGLVVEAVHWGAPALIGQ